MAAHPRAHRVPAALCALFLAAPAARIASAQEAQHFGGAYSQLDPRRQQLVDDWVKRFTRTTGQTLEAGPFYDEILSLSTKTTFDAVTHALMTTPLTDAAGARISDALALVDHVDAVRGEVRGAASDRQFRMYVRLTPDARGTLDRSREFKRGIDNSVYHKGYPINYRARGGAPSLQISIALDGRRADVDVDYRSASFPVAVFNGHLSAANSDVRAGNNADRHAARWSGFQNWWRSFFGVRLERAPDEQAPPSPLALPTTPRAGEENIDVMVNDFLRAWLVEGDVVAAMGYVSQRAYACLAQDAADPSEFDRGMAPYQLMVNLKAAHEVVGTRDSLDGLTVGVRLAAPALKVVRQPQHAQFVVYSVPDDVAATFDCERRLSPAGARKPARAYGNYFGAMFTIRGHQDHRVALLWAREEGYWKIVSWLTGTDEAAMPVPVVAPTSRVVRIKADPSFTEAARTFLESWLIRKDYDAAFRVLSPASYACYDLERSPEAPAATSPEDAGRRVRQAIERVGTWVGTARTLDDVLVAPEPLHPSIRVMDHPYSRTFSLMAVPNALGDAIECDARARGVNVPEPLPLEYGNAFGMMLRFRTGAGDAPVLRLLWRKQESGWRITGYGVEAP
jgi:hypothetical protein